MLETLIGVVCDGAAVQTLRFQIKESLTLSLLTHLIQCRLCNCDVPFLIIDPCRGTDEIINLSCYKMHLSVSSSLFWQLI